MLLLHAVGWKIGNVALGSGEKRHLLSVGTGNSQTGTGSRPGSRSTSRLWLHPPEGLDLRNLLTTLSSDLVDVFGRRPHHLLHTLLLLLLLTCLNRTITVVKSGGLTEQKGASVG